jgi:alkylhydroperoxidase family enzyme
LPAWRETQYFNGRERAAFALVEAVTMISDGQVSDSAYSEATAALSDEEIAAIEWLGVAINAWNPKSVSS